MDTPILETFWPAFAVSFLGQHLLQQFTSSPHPLCCVPELDTTEWVPQTHKSFIRTGSNEKAADPVRFSSCIPSGWSFSITMETAFGFAAEITSELCVTAISTLTWLSTPPKAKAASLCCLPVEFRDKSRMMVCCGFCRADLAYTQHVFLKSLLIWGKKQAGSCLQAKEVLFLLLIVFLPWHTHGTFTDLQSRSGKMRSVGKYCVVLWEAIHWMGNWGSLSVKRRNNSHQGLVVQLEKQKPWCFFPTCAQILLDRVPFLNLLNYLCSLRYIKWTVL